MKADDRIIFRLNFTRIPLTLILKLALFMVGMSAAGLISCVRAEENVLVTTASPLPGELITRSSTVESSTPTQTPKPKEEATLDPILDITPSTPTVSEYPIEETSLPATPTELACLNGSGRMEIHSLRSERLKLPMEYRVWLPPCYDEQPDRRYPVLYMIHGQNYNEDQWDRLGIDETAASLISSGEIPPLIIVMPRDRNWGQPSEDKFGRVLVEELSQPLMPTTKAILTVNIARSEAYPAALAGQFTWACGIGPCFLPWAPIPCLSSGKTPPASMAGCRRFQPVTCHEFFWTLGTVTGQKF